MNVFVSTVSGIFLILTYYQRFANKDVNNLVAKASVITLAVQGLLEIVSGTILIWSVYKIRSYLYSSGNADARINIKTLVIYSAAFTLFAVGVAVNTLFFGILVVKDYSAGSQMAYNISNDILFVCSFCS
jgi:hypothetical protein